jgi:hypothetical protein
MGAAVGPSKLLTALTVMEIPDRHRFNTFAQ